MLDWNWTAAVPTFVITLREGVEAALVVGIVLSLLRQTQRQSLQPWVWAAVVVGLAASALTGGCFHLLFQWIKQSTGVLAQVLEPSIKFSFTLLAIVLLSWMLLWMTEQAKSMKSSVEGELNSKLSQYSNPGWAVFGLVSIAVLREGFETAVFITAQEQADLATIAGAITGIFGAMVIGWMLFSLGIKLNLKLFFQVMGGLLILIVSGLVMSACKSLDSAALILNGLNPVQGKLCLFSIQANQSCLWGPLIWNSHAVLPDTAFPGVILKALLGYRDRIYLGQGLAYIFFLLALSGLYVQKLNQSMKTTDHASTPITH